LRTVFITGSNGLLGQAVTTLLTRETNYELVLSSVEDKSSIEYGHKYEKMDITNKDDVKKIIAYYEPQVIINCAAYTEVDKCETERELCWKINVDGVKNLIIASKRTNSKIIHYSTDYVFDGKSGPYDEEATPDPISFYGRSKLASENALTSSGIDHAIIRTMVLYGIGNNVKKNFALWLVETLKKNMPVTIVTDQIGNTTIVDDLAYGTYKIVEKDKSGIFNIAGKDILSRYDFALKLCEVFGFNKKLVSPILTSELSQPAPRPLNSGLLVLKAESELGINLMDSMESLRLLKVQLGE
jgi:dTDP-4-dehydrorhamnose reductase